MGVEQRLYYKMDLSFIFLFIGQIYLIQAFNISKTACTEDELPCKYGSIDPCTGEPAGADYCLPKFQEGWDGFMCEYTTCPMNCPTPPPTPSVRGGGFKFCEVYDEHGCSKSPGTCINQYDEFPDYLCNSNCPTICKPNELECPGPINSNCPTAGSCIPQTYDVNGFECSSVCPRHCLPGEIFCDAEFDENGCEREDYCRLEIYNFEGRICPSQCEANCKPDELRCDAKFSNGCPERDYCVPSVYIGSLGEPCPGVCEITRCGDNEKVCPGGEDDLGCRQLDFCHPENEFCPPRCKQGEIQCPRSFDCNGKPLESDTCIPESTENCVNHCPTYCYPGEIFCDAELDESGCERQDYCRPENYNFEGHICPTQCEANCKPDEIRCDARISNGCPERDYCVPAEYTNGLGEVCPGVCEITRCGDKEKVCPGGEDDRECRQKDFCYPENEFCPPRCKQGEIQCARSFDCNGKPLESDICIPEFTDSSQTCNNHCPTYCYPDEQFCNGNVLEDGCKNPDFCIKKYADGPHGQLCPLYCPAYCSAVEKLCNGELVDGCRGADFCVPIESECPFES